MTDVLVKEYQEKGIPITLLKAASEESARKKLTAKQTKKVFKNLIFMIAKDP